MLVEKIIHDKNIDNSKVAYGINIKKTKDDTFKRLVILQNHDVANNLFDLLIKSNLEAEEIEIEQIIPIRITSANTDGIQYQTIRIANKPTVKDISKPLEEFETEMKQQLPMIDKITDEEEYDDEDNVHYHRYICWLKFPYASTCSDAGYFSFCTEEEFHQLIEHSLFRHTVKDVFENRIKYESYQDFIKLYDKTCNRNKGCKAELKLKALKILYESL